MAVQFRRQKGMGDEIPTASMADIAFLLLIFFLVTTIFNQEQGLPMTLPGQASETAKINRKNILDIEVQANNLVYLDGTQFMVPAIESEIRRRILGNDKLIIQLKVHTEAFYGTMVNLLDELQLADATKLNGVVMTSSPGPIFRDLTQRCKAAVPLLTAVANWAPVNSQKARSNSGSLGPRLN